MGNRFLWGQKANKHLKTVTPSEPVVPSNFSVSFFSKLRFWKSHLLNGNPDWASKWKSCGWLSPPGRTLVCCLPTPLLHPWTATAEETARAARPCFSGAPRARPPPRSALVPAHPLLFWCLTASVSSVVVIPWRRSAFSVKKGEEAKREAGTVGNRGQPILAAQNKGPTQGRGGQPPVHLLWFIRACVTSSGWGWGWPIRWGGCGVAGSQGAGFYSQLGSY